MDPELEENRVQFYEHELALQEHGLTRRKHELALPFFHLPKSAVGCVDPANVAHCMTTQLEGFDFERYTLVRLSNLRYYTDIETKLDELVSHDEILSIVELEDASLELPVLISFLPSLQDQLLKMVPGYKIDLNYNPTEPKESDVEFCYEIAKFVESDRFRERAERMEKGAWPQAAAFYSHLKTIYLK